MLLLLPISRYRVEYQVAAGRPYSIFERLILQAIYEGAFNVVALREIFHVHPRLILEALVTLTQAGWLSVGGAELYGDFRLTSAGEDAVLSGREPRSRSISAARTWIVMERLTGALINESMVRYFTTSYVDGLSNKAVKIAEKVHHRRLSEGAVDALLPRSRNEWLFHIDSIDLKSRQAHWLPITYDPLTREFDENLPGGWRGRVGPALEEEARRSPQFADVEARNVVGPRSSGRRAERKPDDEGDRPLPIYVVQEDIIISNEEHFFYLQEVFDCAGSNIFIASAFMREGCLEALRPSIMSALSRGVVIDILWGYNSGRSGEADGLDILKKISYEARNSRLKGRITFNRTPSMSHGKVIVWDRSGTFEACVGSFNWLSVSPYPTNHESSNSGINLSIRLRDRLLVSRLLRAIVSLWTGGFGDRHLDAAPERWRWISADLERDGRELVDSDVASSSNAKARIVIDRDHRALLRSSLMNIGQQLIVISHKLGVAAQTRLFSSSVGNGTDKKFLVLYGQRDVDERAFLQIEKVVRDAGGALSNKRGLHAKAIIADDWFCIGSYNFLSADAYTESSGTKELSILVECPEVVNWLRDRVVEF